MSRVSHRMFYAATVMRFNLALSGWGDRCGRPLRCPHQSAPLGDRLFGKDRLWLPWVVRLVFPSYINHFRKTLAFLYRTVRATHSTVDVKLEPIRNVLHGVDFMTIDCTDHVLPEDTTLKNLA